MATVYVVTAGSGGSYRIERVYLDPTRRTVREGPQPHARDRSASGQLRGADDAAYTRPSLTRWPSGHVAHRDAGGSPQMSTPP